MELGTKSPKQLLMEAIELIDQQNCNGVFIILQEADADRAVVFTHASTGMFVADILLACEEWKLKTIRLSTKSREVVVASSGMATQ